MVSMIMQKCHAGNLECPFGDQYRIQNLKVICFMVQKQERFKKWQKKKRIIIIIIIRNTIRFFPRIGKTLIIILRNTIRFFPRIGKTLITEHLTKSVIK